MTKICGAVFDVNYKRYWFSDGDLYTFYENEKDEDGRPFTGFYKNCIETSYNVNGAYYINGKEIECSSQEEFDKLLKLKAFL